MIDLPYETYAWVKTLHVIAVTTWMAGLFYLPRLFVYHAGVAAGSEASETFKIMERRLLKGIMHPSLIVVIATGIVLFLNYGDYEERWLWAKAILAWVLVLYHLQLSLWRRAFAADRNRHRAVFYRWWNEFPTVVFVGIVILVIVRPF